MQRLLAVLVSLLRSPSLAPYRVYIAVAVLVGVAVLQATDWEYRHVARRGCAAAALAALGVWMFKPEKPAGKKPAAED